MPMDQEAIVAGLIRHRGRIFAYIWSILRDDHLAEDVFQEVSVLAIRKRETIEDADHLPGWLREAARNCARNMVRSEARRPRPFNDHVLDLLEGQWRANDHLSPSDALEALRRCLDELAPNARQIVRLRYHDNLTGQRLADAAGRSINTAYVTLTRAHKALAACVRSALNTDA